MKAGSMMTKAPKTRSAGVGKGYPSGPSPRKGKSGKKPKKGVLTKGGGHG